VQVSLRNLHHVLAATLWQKPLSGSTSDSQEEEEEEEKKTDDDEAQ
jgi:hypothetical protein